MCRRKLRVCSAAPAAASNESSSRRIHSALAVEIPLASASHASRKRSLNWASASRSTGSNGSFSNRSLDDIRCPYELTPVWNARDIGHMRATGVPGGQAAPRAADHDFRAGQQTRPAASWAGLCSSRAPMRRCGSSRSHPVPCRVRSSWRRDRSPSRRRWANLATPFAR